MSNVVSMAIPSGFLHSVSYITGRFEEGGTANELNRWFA